MLTTVCLHLNEPKQPTGSHPHPQPRPKTTAVHRGTYCVEFLSSDVGFFAWRESSERLLHLRARLDVLCLTTDHEGHVLLQWHVAIPETSTETSADCTVSRSNTQLSTRHPLTAQSHTATHNYPQYCSSITWTGIPPSRGAAQVLACTTVTQHGLSDG